MNKSLKGSISFHNKRSSTIFDSKDDSTMFSTVALCLHSSFFYDEFNASD